MTSAAVACTSPSDSAAPCPDPGDASADAPGDGASPDGPSDHAAPDAPLDDAAPGPDGGEAGSDAASSDADAAPDGGATAFGQPRALVSGKSLRLLAVTQDDWAVYHDLTTKELRAIPLAGGTPITLLSNYQQDGYKPLAVHGKVVFAWVPTGASNAWSLTVWRTSGQPHVVTGAVPSFGAAASADGDRIVFRRTVGNAEAFVGTTSDLAMPEITLGTASGDCDGTVLAVGPRLVTATCGTNRSMNIDSWDSTFTKTHLFDDAELVLGHDLNGGTVFAVTGVDHALQSRSVAGGAPLTYDTGVFAYSDYQGTTVALSPDGSRIVYPLVSAGYKWSPTANAAPAVLPGVGGSAGFIHAISPDNTYFVFNTGSSFRLGSFAAGDLRELSPSSFARAYTDWFTRDSAYALFLDGTFTNGLVAAPVAGGLPIVGMDTDNMSATHGSKVIYGEKAHAAIDVVDPSAPALPAKRLDSLEESIFFLDHARDGIACVAITSPDTQTLEYVTLP